MPDALLRLERLDDSRVDEELAISQYSCVHGLAILFALFLLD